MALFAIAAGLGIASSILGINSSNKARKSQKGVDSLVAKRSTIANIRNRRTAMASIRRQQAKGMVSAIASGVAGGSSQQGTKSSLTSQGADDIGNQLQMEGLGAQINTQISTANKYSNQASNYNSLGQVIGQGAQLIDSFKAPPTSTVPGLPNGTL